jgi:hypothetical protein
MLRLGAQEAGKDVREHRLPLPGDDSMLRTSRCTCLAAVHGSFDRNHESSRFNAYGQRHYKLSGRLLYCLLCIRECDRRMRWNANGYREGRDETRATG